MRFSDFKDFFPASRFWLFFNPLQLTKSLILKLSNIRISTFLIFQYFK